MGRKPSFTMQQVLEAVQALTVEHGMPPTISELKAYLNVGSSRTVLRYLAALQKEGFIERWPGARGIRVLRAPATGLTTRPVPVVGTAPAGPLMLAEENREGVVRLPTAYLRPSDSRFFLLRVRGHSMNRASVDGGRIDDGDLVLVRQQSVANPGQIVVALIDGKATIKRLAQGSGYLVLKPESSEPHQPIVVRPGFRVQGVVVRVLKNGSELIVED
jgi:repressor LexA